jgi:hypothetical protein
MILPITLLIGINATAQQMTLRERIADEHSDISVAINVDGPQVSLQRMVEQTDSIVRAVVGSIESHLSDNGQDIFTTYELVNPQILFEAKATTTARSGIRPAAITLSQPGGTVNIDGFTATVRYDDVPVLATGMEVVAFLHDSDTRHVAAARRGLFEVRQSTIVPLVSRTDDHQKFAGVRVDDFLAQAIALRSQINQR